MTPPALHGELRRRHGLPCPPLGFSGRWLGPESVDAVIALHAAVHAEVAPELLCRESDDFFADHIARRGRILGLFAEERLIAYGVLGLPQDGEPSFADALGLPAAAAACIDGASVAPAWRGNGLHRLLIAERLRRALACGRAVAVSTVAPGNTPSLRNLFAAGLTIRALGPRFGGMRYVVRRDLDRPLPTAPERGRWIAVADLAAQSTALARGEAGWALSPAETPPAIWFGA